MMNETVAQWVPDQQIENKLPGNIKKGQILCYVFFSDTYLYILRLMQFFFYFLIN